MKRNGGPKWQICGLLLCLRSPASLRETERSAGAAGTTNPSRTATAAELVMIGCAASAVCTMHVERLQTELTPTQHTHITSQWPSTITGSNGERDQLAPTLRITTCGTARVTKP